MWPHSSPRQLFHFFLTRLHILLSRWWCLNSLWFSSAEMRLMLTFPRIMNDTVHQSQAKILGALNFKDVKSLNPAQGLWTGLVKFYKPLSPFHRLLRGELPPDHAPTLLYHPRVCNRGRESSVIRVDCSDPTVEGFWTWRVGRIFLMSRRCRWSGWSSRPEAIKHVNRGGGEGGGGQSEVEGRKMVGRPELHYWDDDSRQIQHGVFWRHSFKVEGI